MVAGIPRAVLDTNVLVAALRSQRGASYQLLRALDREEFTPILSVPLVFEYEDVLKRHSRQIGITHPDIDDFLDFICSVSELRQIYFLWRPALRDPSDDMILEVAVEAQASIVTHNTRDFDAAPAYHIPILTPAEFLRQIGAL